MDRKKVESQISIFESIFCGTNHSPSEEHEIFQQIVILISKSPSFL